MTASLLQAFMDQLMNLLLAAVAIIIGGITAMAVIDSAPRMSRWGFSNVLAFFGKGENANWTVQVERDGKTYNLPKEMMAKLQTQGYEVYEGADKNQIYMRLAENGETDNKSFPIGTTDNDWEIEEGDNSFLEDYDHRDAEYAHNDHEFLNIPDSNFNSYEFLKYESTDNDEEPLEHSNDSDAYNDPKRYSIFVRD